MRIIISCITLASVIFIGCQQNKAAENSRTDYAKAANTQADEMAAPNLTIPAAIDLLGSYTGDFADNRITVLLTEVTEDSVHGRSIVAGTDQVFTGAVSKSGDIFHFVAKEPGTGKHDGIFDFTIDEKVATTLSGSWKPYDSLKIKAKGFTLEKKKFVYDPNNGETEASMRLLKSGDVENEDKWSLAYMRNEIFARHGYSFSRRETRDMFEMQEWYVPYSVDVTKDLTNIEIKNIKLIKNYEKYAKDYGDDYGR